MELAIVEVPLRIETFHDSDSDSQFTRKCLSGEETGDDVIIPLSRMRSSHTFVWEKAVVLCTEIDEYHL